MSTWSDVTLTPAEGQPALTEEEMEALAEPLYLNDLMVKTGSFAGGSKWTTDEIGALCMDYTAKNPGATAEWREEWNAMDADEQGESVTFYENGEIVPSKCKNSGLLPANLAELLKKASDALEHSQENATQEQQDALRVLVEALS